MSSQWLRRVLTVSLFSLSLSSGSASATSWGSQVVYYVQVHFTQFAYGKSVRSVVAHAGVLMQEGVSWMGQTEKLYWADSQRINLENRGDHFVGKLILHSTDSKFGPFLKYPLIEYFVTFDDGSSTVTVQYPLAITSQHTVSTAESFRYAQYDREESLGRLQDTSRTEASELGYVIIY